ncbi:MAG TPA: YeeE/YedE family protein [bacterium]|nr:YeeE/YedE family protein [bacterium]
MIRDLPWVLVSGMLFGAGLAVSGMIRPEVVLSFLTLQDLGLLFVLGGAVVVTFVTYRVAPKVLGRPPAGESFAEHPAKLGRDTVIGAALFGIGWGLSGVCPAPAFAGLGTGNWMLLLSIAGMAIGAWVHGLLQSKGGSR